MSTSRIVLWFLSLMALFILMLMNFVWTVPQIEAAAEGLRVFDNRPFGYSVAEAEAFLKALNDEGKAIYLGVQRNLDTVFPLLLMVAMPWALWVMSDGWPLLLRSIGVVCGFVGGACDLIENGMVARLLAEYPENFNVDLVEVASHFSMAKWTLDVLGASLLVIFGWHLLLKRWSPA